MKKNISLAIIFALCICTIGITGCKVYEPCQSPAYKTNSDNVVTGSEVVTVKKEKKLNLWLGFDEFYALNGIVPEPGDEFAVAWKGWDSLTNFEEGVITSDESECGTYISLPFYNAYAMHIGLLRNGQFQTFPDAEYDSTYSSTTSVGNEFITDITFYTSNL